MTISQQRETNVIIKLKSLLFEFQNSLFRLFIKIEFLREDKKEKFEFLGNSYSGYWFPTNLIDSKGTIWGVGLGRDSSFEKILSQRGFHFFGFEPEVNCYLISKRQFEETSAILENYGLWDKSGEFHYTGENISIVNIFDLQDKSREKLVIRSLWDVAEEKHLLSHASPRILKLNIEGAEREILVRLLREPLDFEVIIFQAEFLFHIGFKKIMRKIKAYQELRTVLSGLNHWGWEIRNLSRHQITLIKSQGKNKSGRGTYH
jgi:FkbM family methyltransferase